MFKEENNMKFKKFMALGLVAAMTATLFAGCGSKGSDSADGTQKADSASSDGLVSYSDIVLGETGKDLSATITMFNHRTDMDTDDYGGKNWKSYLEDFNKEYPNIKVEIIQHNMVFVKRLLPDAQCFLHPIHRSVIKRIDLGDMFNMDYRIIQLAFSHTILTAHPQNAVSVF